MSLTFVAQHGHYSEYVSEAGDTINLAHGQIPWVEMISFDDADLSDLWDDWISPLGYRLMSEMKDTFIAHLRLVLIENYLVDDIYFCVSCDAPFHVDDMISTCDGRNCESCFENYYSCCERCEEYVSSDDVTAIGDEFVCDYCRNRYYGYCDECDEYYHLDYADEHDHEDEGSCDGCESRQLKFTVRNDGDAPLANDTRVTVTLPSGTIDDEGMTRISGYLRSNGDDDSAWNASRLLTEIGPVWQTKDGNFTKRLSRALHKTYGEKLTQDQLSQIGNIAREHSTAVDFSIEITRDLNMRASAFYHGDSCWWGSYSAGRCALKTNGGFGLRTFDKDGNVSGRAWIMPLKSVDTSWLGGKHLVPTYDTETPDAFVVFNGYGALTGYTPARIMSHMAGWTYRKVGFSCSPMFINSDNGYLIGAEELVAPYTDGDLSLDVDQHGNPS